MQIEKKVSKRRKANELRSNPTELDLRISYFLSTPEIRNRHRKIFKTGKEKDILIDYIKGMSMGEIAEKYQLSYPTVHKFLTDFYLLDIDEKEVKKIVYADLSEHANVLASFFAGVAHLSQDMAFNAIISKKIREELSKLLFEKGISGVLEDRKLLAAWQSSLKRTEMIINQINQQTNIYLSLLEKILDKQRETAFISALYRIMSELDPEVAYKLQEALYRDEYARALLEAQNTEELIALISEIFTNKKSFEQSKNIIETSGYVVDTQQDS